MRRGWFENRRLHKFVMFVIIEGLPVVDCNNAVVCEDSVRGGMVGRFLQMM